MRYFKLPDIDLPVSVVGLGAGTRIFTNGEYGRGAELLDAFVAAGGNCVDTAHIYGFGASEEILGRWLKERGARHQVVLISKGCHPAFDREDVYGKPWVSRVTPEAIRADLDESLGRLQTDHIDLYLLHRDDERVPVGPIVEALNQEQARGRIRAFGGSNWRVERIAAANDYAKEHQLNGFCISSPQFSLMRPAKMFFPGTVFASDADRKWHTAHRFPMLAWAALGEGSLSRKASTPAPTSALANDIYDSRENAERVRRACELAARYGVTPTQIGLAFVLHQAFPILALVGPTTVLHLEEALGGVEVELNEEDITYLEAVN